MKYCIFIGTSTVNVTRWLMPGVETRLCCEKRVPSKDWQRSTPYYAGGRLAARGVESESYFFKILESESESPKKSGLHIPG